MFFIWFFIQYVVSLFKAVVDSDHIFWARIASITVFIYNFVICFLAFHPYFVDVDACYRCKPFVLQCSPVERASRSLARTGLFFSVFEVLFSCLFSARFLEGVGRVFWRPYGSFWINFEVIWESCLLLFGDKVDFWKRVFYNSKTVVFKVWEGSDSWLFPIVFLISIFWAFFNDFCGFCWVSESP